MVPLEDSGKLRTSRIRLDTSASTRLVGCDRASLSNDNGNRTTLVFLPNLECNGPTLRYLDGIIEKMAEDLLKELCVRMKMRRSTLGQMEVDLDILLCLYRCHG
jgi:hypothetical protein